MQKKNKMKRIATIVLTLSLFGLISCTSPKPEKVESLVPPLPPATFDYFNTWNVQGFVASYTSNDDMVKAMNEKNIFGSGKYENWVSFYPELRGDLIFVLDFSWDTPQDVNSMDNDYLGTVRLDTTRFPSYKEMPADRLKKLADDIKAKGWKGIGVWICAQKAETTENISEEDYWIERLKEADDAGVGYWKVDWGKHANSEEWRKMLSDLGKKYAPDLIIEHAFENRFIEFSDAFRTYDVENVIAQTVTLQRVANLLKFKSQPERKAIINCEDEAYIAAGLGCAMGIQRHPFNGNLPDGNQDFVFPPVGRDLKNRLDETKRGVRWHRIAAPIGVGGEYQIDSVELTDYWVLKDKETWMPGRKAGDTIKVLCPARISRGLPLPQVSSLHSDDQPYVLATKYPNGAVAVATIGRSLGHDYVLKQETVSLKLDEFISTFGIFGDYQELILEFPGKIKTDITIYGQDLAGEEPVNLKSKIKIDGKNLVIPGEVIREVGLMASAIGDLSDPGMVLKINF